MAASPLKVLPAAVGIMLITLIMMIKYDITTVILALIYPAAALYTAASKPYLLSGSL